MKKQFLLLFILIILTSTYATIYMLPISKDKFLTKHNLYQEYQSIIKQVKEKKIWNKELPAFDTTIETIINSPFNTKYKIANLKETFEQSPYNWYAVNKEFVPQLAVFYDHPHAIKYLERKKNKTLSETFQLMVLYHIYKPNKIKTKTYNNLIQFAHQEIQEYFKQQKFQSSWRSEEYNDITKGNYAQCYKDTKCLLDIIPYWMSNENIDVIIPCEIAQKYNKVAYFDEAFGGQGSQSFITSDCPLYPQYQYPKDLEKYSSMLFYENLPYSDGSIRFFYYARSTYKDLIDWYYPQFDHPKQKDWKDFPYTDWSTLSYYNFKKYNEVLNYGIGYPKALEELTQHYIKNFNVSFEKAYNTALYTLKIPSMEDWDIISKDNLNYMLLTGQDFETIQTMHKDLNNYHQYLHLSIAHPKNLQKLISLGQKEKKFDIDYPNWFGKTPLMVASQYGYLESIKILLENKADINKQTDEGNCWSENGYECIYNGKRTPLMYALQEGQFEVAKYLIENNADISIKDDKGNLALDYMLGKAPYRSTQSSNISGGQATYQHNRESPFTKEQQEILIPLLTISTPSDK